MSKDKKFKLFSFGYKTAAAVLKTFYYIFVVSIFILAIAAILVLLINTSPENTLLPPIMRLDDNVYSITIGSGIRMECPFESVSTGDIKTVILAELLQLGVYLLILAPICIFLSKLFKNISKFGKFYIDNPQYIKYIALSIGIGVTVQKIAESFYNYLLVKTFASSPETVKYAFDFNIEGILIGVLIYFLAVIYSSACEKASNSSRELSVTENES